MHVDLIHRQRDFFPVARPKVHSRYSDLGCLSFVEFVFQSEHRKRKAAGRCPAATPRAKHALDLGEKAIADHDSDTGTHIQFLNRNTQLNFFQALINSIRYFACMSRNGKSTRGNPLHDFTFAPLVQ